MKKKFSEFNYKPDYEKLWNECDFVFDANVFIDLYYDRNVYNNFVDILEKKISDRVWMPYQVGLEYHINRVDGVKKISDDYNKFINSIQNLKGIKTIYNNLNKAHSIDLGKYMDLEEISETITDLEEYSKDLNSKIDENPNFLDDDEIMNKLHDIFEGKTGEQYPDSEINKIYEEGKIRNENKIPPSFKDKGYGDLVLWKQIIDHALEKDCPIILVTGDSKKDWWLTSNKEPMCPHPILIKEFVENTSNDFYMYKLSDFLQESMIYLDTNVETKTIETAKEIQEINDLFEKVADNIDLYTAKQGIIAEATMNSFSRYAAKQGIIADAIMKLIDSKEFMEMISGEKNSFNDNTDEGDQENDGN